MATSWSISIGYNSGLASRNEGWHVLVDCVEKIRRDPALLMHEAANYGAPVELDGERLTDYCTIYQQDVKDYGPMQVIFDPHDECQCKIFTMASGGDPSRTMKEHVARAFCRLVIQAMHLKGIEVNLHVA